MPTTYPYTVRAAVLTDEADQIERDANSALPAWILLGETDRYSRAMETARRLRQAARTRSIRERREMLQGIWD